MPIYQFINKIHFNKKLLFANLSKTQLIHTCFLLDDRDYNFLTPRVYMLEMYTKCCIDL